MDSAMLRRSDENRAVTPGKAMRAVDRFIPSRSALDLDIAHYNLVKENTSGADVDLASEVASPSKVRRIGFGDRKSPFGVYGWFLA
jgi:hypothetical protein